MAKKKKKKENSIASSGKEEREDSWDDLYLKEEGVVVEFDANTNTGKVRSLNDDQIYKIDSRELVRTRIELCPDDKVLFAPFEDTDGKDYARIISIIELNV
jgi:hypothetical protein